MKPLKRLSEAESISKMLPDLMCYQSMQLYSVSLPSVYSSPMARSSISEVHFDIARHFHVGWCETIECLFDVNVVGLSYRNFVIVKFFSSCSLLYVPSKRLSKLTGREFVAKQKRLRRIKFCDSGRGTFILQAPQKTFSTMAATWKIYGPIRRIQQNDTTTLAPSSPISSIE
ncbi:hypothetical protein MKW98_005931 [Papaver atlanticum]|uniref:Uncharacterized protein n=1 Tax=Papaver atlanticum TaxID=357466 RepID=A0AAD4TF74_9MAGN|nr:hypothetical protein MKW98_005931 [Papaver atlanticum]